MRDDNGILKKARIKYYNKRKQITKITHNYIHNELEKPLVQWEYFYDRKKIRFKEIKTKWWNDIKTSIIYFYNEKGDVNIAQTLKDGEIKSKQSFKFKYKLDKNKNWISKIKLGGIYKETENRIIEYY